MEDYEYRVIKLHAIQSQTISKFTGNVSKNTSRFTSRILGDNLAQGIDVVARSSDETPSIYPKKVGEIGESRKGVAVSFPFCLVSVVSRMVSWSRE